MTAISLNAVIDHEDISSPQMSLSYASGYILENYHHEANLSIVS